MCEISEFVDLIRDGEDEGTGEHGGKRWLGTDVLSKDLKKIFVDFEAVIY